MKKILFTLLFLVLALFSPHKVHAEESVGGKLMATCWADSSDHAGASNCIYDHLKTYQERLSKAEGAAAGQAAQDDVEYGSLYKSLDVDYAGALEKSFETFHAYMNAECERIRHRYLTGNGAGDAEVVCKINIIHERLGRLETKNEQND